MKIIVKYNDPFLIEPEEIFDKLEDFTNKYTYMKSYFSEGREKFNQTIRIINYDYPFEQIIEFKP